MDEELKKEIENLISQKVGSLSESLEDIKAAVAAKGKDPEGDPQNEEGKCLNEDKADKFMPWLTGGEEKK